MKRAAKNKVLKLTREIVRVLDDGALQDARGGGAVCAGGSNPPTQDGSQVHGCVVAP